MQAAHRAALLGAARNAVAVSLGVEAERVDPAELVAPLSEPAGAFVTLHIDAALRGCIGTFQAEQPLAGTVREMAVAAASRDPRFPPLDAAELPEVSFEISV